MSRAALAVLAGLALAFFAGWQVKAWQRDSVDLAIARTAAATGKVVQDIASASGRRLEDKLADLQKTRPKEIRHEFVKPVFTNVCVSDEFVRMFNDDADRAERALSGKPQNEMPGKTTTP
ncbi:hypothetical protein AW40_18325 [Kosakonia radicincitans UMEnt01/12]|uniref:hypothetical protein n=1 Tax=Kosakonia radicincitans TaxID=283686 RepID=UPI000461FF34|nr:hypothetical protein [Kosakonia radicincitans]KDE35123.1 hypothetical protein AW40_18325 [Kosakonia radicincitans UMEnt01/12]